MQAPTPREPLTGHCSVIRNNTLYVYSPQAFQALPLETNGTWSQLNTGVSVSGAACVGSEDTLWVVGGIPSSSGGSYTGLQTFTYANSSWQTVTPIANVTQNRQGHAAALLSEPEMILIYGGSQLNSSVPTTETFLISTQPPYAVQSFSAKNIPVASPLLLSWDNSSAITLAGARNGTNVYRFQVDSGWGKIMPSLPTSLKSSDMQQATLIQGSDNSRVLQLYDISVSPNNVSQIVLQNANGQPARSGSYIGQAGTKKRKRALSLADWPVYNQTNAPTATRSGFALARSDIGVVAISGGGDPNQSVALFNEQQNAWVNTTSFFGASSQQPLTPISIPPTPSSTHSAIPQPPSDGDDHHRTELILGATLGSILGFIALLMMLLLFLRWRRRKKAQQRLKQAELEEEEEDEKDRLSFVDRGDPLAKEIGGIVYPASHHSLSVHEGRTGHNTNHQRSETRGSEHSTSYLVPKGANTYEMSPIGEKAPALPVAVDRASQASTTLQVPATLTSPPRSTGWSRYFSGTDRLSVSTRSSTGNGSERTATLGRAPPMPLAGSKHSSNATSNHDCQNHGPTQLPPLDMGKRFAGDRTSAASVGAQEDDRRSSRISSMRESGETERPRTRGSNYSRQSTAPSVWSDFGREEQTNWTPMTQSGSDRTSRRTRDTTTSSFYGSATDSYYKSGKLYSSTVAPPSFSLTAPPASSEVGPSQKTVAEQDKDSHQAAKAIAVRVEQAPLRHEAQQATVQTDLSWLQLGTAKP